MTYTHHGDHQYVAPYPSQDIPWGRVRELPSTMVSSEGVEANGD